MKKIQEFKVVPYLPDKLKPLLKIAENLWWVWNFEAIDLFRRIDVDLWRELGHNPINFLGSLPQKALDAAAASESFISHMHRVEAELDRHLSRITWYEQNKGDIENFVTAYFSAEFGIHECIPIYSGGLGILAGDHLKSASELGVPLYGMGLLYRLGYFRQYLNLDGWQQERYPETDFYNIPISLVKGSNGGPVVIGVEYPGRTVYAQIWKVVVGKVTLFLLDTNIDKNSPEDRAITDQLYGGDSEMRVKQEIMLGIGGVRAFRALGINITVYHMNEGHAAFLAIERIRNEMKEHGMTFDEAHTFVTATNIFTTHTPVPAGNDRFSPALIDKYFSHFYSEFGIDSKRFMALGRENPFDEEEDFCMTVLAIKTAFACNGVSKLHGDVSRKMWNRIWPKLPSHEVPIGHITNGVQTLSWTSDEMMRLFNRYLGPGWIDNPASRDIWKGIDNIPDSELWRCRERLRERLVSFARKRLHAQLIARGVPLKQASVASSVLDPEALTIGFARRFATYKRATLLFKNLDRLMSILLNTKKPVQIVFSGKAHPRDTQGKEFIKEIIHVSRDERLRKKIVFLEDYDINTARYMIQGVDLWLNTPIRPKEASGTSGMKVVVNGGINVSVLDGWWDEAYNSANGWAIGNGEVYEDQSYQDEVESLAIYNLLEEEIIPLFYSRGEDGLPYGWLGRIRESMKTIIPEFNTNRMVKDYAEKYYFTAHKNFINYLKDDFHISREVSHWKERIKKVWSDAKVIDMNMEANQEVTVGKTMKVTAKINLGRLDPADVLVELYFGSVNQYGDISDGASTPMSPVSSEGNGIWTYTGQMLCLQSGRFGYSVRIIPFNKNAPRKFDPELPITWA
ncbi:MAG TPA: alpha-glucan family phosphorylase [Spirochaetota bacterium]|nr:alpha-glucan family phosphorylase [Spirochaetota bacterium]